MTPTFRNTTHPSGSEVGKRWRPGKWTWAGLVLVLLAIFYTLAGFYLVPRIIRSQATAWVKTNLNQSLALGQIKFNPFTFTLDVSDLALPADAKPIVSIGHLRVGFSILSVFQHAYYFREVRLDRPTVRAVLQPDHSLNLAKLEPHTQSSGSSKAVRIGVLSVTQGQIFYADDSQPQRPEEILTPVAFTLKDFQTNRAGGGAFTLNAKSEHGEGFAWTGNLSIAPVSSQGRITITALEGATIQEFAGQYLPVTLRHGVIGCDMNYNLSSDQTGLRLTMRAPALTFTNVAVDGKSVFNGTAQLAQFQTSIGELQLTDAKNGVMQLRTTVPQATAQGLRITPSGNAAGQTIQLATATFKEIGLDNQDRKLSVGSLALSGLDLPLRRERDGRINLMEMLPKKSATHGVKAPPPPRNAAWKVNLAAFTLDNAKVRYEDEAISPTAHYNVTPITVSVSGASSDLKAPVSVKLSAKIDGRTAIAAQGTVTPAVPRADVTFKLSNVALRQLFAYLPPHPALDLKSGTFNASGKLRAQGSNRHRGAAGTIQRGELLADLMATAQFTGDATINDFSLYETTGNSELFAWRAFAFNRIDYSAKHLTIDHARLSHPSGGVTILPNSTFNFQPLMAANTSPAQNTSETAKTSGKPVAAHTPPKTAPAARVATSAPAPAMQVRVKRLDIDDGLMSFADYSVNPNFHADIKGLEGAITNISNLPTEVATIDLKGQVIDQYSPVTINGTMNLLAYDRQTNVHLVFRNIDLPVFNPYSGRYAGYAIDRGKLTTDITYKIVNRGLQANHHIVIDQLKWGKATGTKPAVPVPIRLATTLLKDKNGVITLDLPVNGSLDDPKFRVGPIISEMVGNLVKKTVTAPFRHLGSLFHGAEKAQYVDFSLGSADLPAGSGEALGALAKAMADRPELGLDIPAVPTTPEDARAIANAEIDKQAMGNNTNTGGFTALNAGDQYKDLLNVYQAKLGKTPQYPEFTPDALKAASNKSDLDEDGRRQILETQWLRTQLEASFTPSNAQLAALGAARAKAIRDALVTEGKVDPGRVFMANDLTATVADGKSRVELKIK